MKPTCEPSELVSALFRCRRLLMYITQTGCPVVYEIRQAEHCESAERHLRTGIPFTTEKFARWFSRASQLYLSKRADVLSCAKCLSLKSARLSRCLPSRYPREPSQFIIHSAMARSCCSICQFFQSGSSMHSQDRMACLSHLFVVQIQPFAHHRGHMCRHYLEADACLPSPNHARIVPALKSALPSPSGPAASLGRSSLWCTLVRKTLISPWSLIPTPYHCEISVPVYLELLNISC